MKIVVFWDTIIQFIPHRKYITPQFLIPADKCYIRFDVYMAVNMKNAIFLDVTPFGSCKNRYFGGKYRSWVVSF
jgi:hypothetical protein